MPQLLLLVLERAQLGEQSPPSAIATARSHTTPPGAGGPTGALASLLSSVLGFANPHNPCSAGRNGALAKAGALTVLMIGASRVPNDSTPPAQSRWLCRRDTISRSSPALPAQ